jgi:predicted small lipoprotein YifL
MAPTFILAPGTRRRLAIGVALTAILVAAAGCGRRGALEAPPGAAVAPTHAQPQRIVAPAAEVTTSDFADLDTNPDLLVDDSPRADGLTRPVAVAPGPVDPNKPRKSFILDPLVN